ncbi:extracellular solute-binding protein [Cohnella soli]|uniref:Extracellular solute-binding protein n=1 Tax=Cohnella soli TaxID=425005 RepID=A0ABW0HQN0_9BACL
MAKRAGKKSVVLLLAIMTAAGTLSACSKSNSGSASQSASSDKPEATQSAAPENVDPLGKFDPPITVNIGRSVGTDWKYAPGESIDKNRVYDFYESGLGVKLVNEFAVAGDQYSSKVNTVIASGQIPDMMLVDGVQLRNLVKAGMVEDLSGLYDKYVSPDTKKMLDEDGGYAIKSSTVDGKLYGIPVTTQGYWSAMELWIRQDWLDNLGLQPPKTTDELIAVAKAFTEQDPDKNNKKDTFGLALSKELMNPFIGYFNSFHAYPGAWVTDAGGKAVYGSIQPEMKAPLEKLAELYKQGIIDPEFGVKDVEKMKESIASGKVGMAFGNFAFPLGSLKQSYANNPDAVWNAYPMPSVDGTPSKAYIGSTASGYWVVRKGYEHPEAVVKLANFWVQNWVVHQVEDEKYGSDPDTGVLYYVYGIVNPLAPMTHIPEFRDVKAALLAHEQADSTKNTPNVFAYLDGINKYLKDPKNSKDPSIQNGWAFNRSFGTPKSGLEVLDEYYYKNNYILSTPLKVASTPAMAEKMPTLKKMEDAMIMKIILGDEGIDSFDRFVSDWNKLGGDKITEEVNSFK